MKKLPEIYWYKINEKIKIDFAQDKLYPAMVRAV